MEEKLYPTQEHFPEVNFAKNFTRAGYDFYYASNLNEAFESMEKIFSQLHVKLVYAFQEPIFEFLTHFDVAFTQEATDNYDLILVKPIAISENGGVKSLPLAKTNVPVLFMCDSDSLVIEKDFLSKEYPAHTAFLLYENSSNE